MPSSIDHVVIAVRDLAEASQDFADLGFTVTPGGEHAHRGSHNALIPFADGSYIEVIAFRDVGSRSGDDWWDLLQKGEGWVDYALLSDDLETEAARFRVDGLEVAGPNPGGRLRPDGQEVAWRIVRPAQTDSARLPFVIEDVTARDLRVASGAQATHANGARGLLGVINVVRDLDEASVAYGRLLGVRPSPSETGLEGAGRSVRFTLGDHWLQLVQPDETRSELRENLDLRGPGPFEIVISITGDGGRLPLDRAHGARILLQSTPNEE
jgi:catechol 2,3-dioxygenase-like lactoylglutathione lyase family enzyme